MDNYRFQINEWDPGKIYTPGISHGYGVGSRCDLLHKVGNFIVVRIPGASDFSGRGQTEYYGAQYILGEIYDKYGDYSFSHFKVLERVQPGRKWCATKKEFIQKAEELAKQEEK